MAIEQVVAIMGAISTLIGVFLALWARLQFANKTELDQLHCELDILRGIIDAQAAEIQRLRKSQAELHCENAALRKRVRVLEEENKQLRDL